MHFPNTATPFFDSSDYRTQIETGRNQCLASFLYTIWQSHDCQCNCPGRQEYQSCQLFSLQLFSKHQVREHDSHKNDQFIHRGDHTCRTFLQCTVIAQPRHTCSNAGKTDKEEFFPVDPLYLLLLSSHKYHPPRKNKHHSCADRGSQISFLQFLRFYIACKLDIIRFVPKCTRTRGRFSIESSSTSFFAFSSCVIPIIIFKMIMPINSILE